MIKVPALNMAVTRSMAALAATLETDRRKRVATSKAKAPASKNAGTAARKVPAAVKRSAVSKTTKKVPAAKPAPKKVSSKAAAKPKVVRKKPIAKAVPKGAASKTAASKPVAKKAVGKAVAKPATKPAAKSAAKPAVRSVPTKTPPAKARAAKAALAKVAPKAGAKPAPAKAAPPKAARAKAPPAKATPPKAARAKAPPAKAAPAKAVPPPAKVSATAKPKAAASKPVVVPKAAKAPVAKPQVVAARVPAATDKKLKSEPVRKAPARPEPKPVSTVRKVINLDEIKLPEGYRPSPGEEYMCAQHLAYFKQKLDNWRQELITESQETLEHLRTETRDVGDEAERASRESDNILELRTRDRYRKLLSKIEQAIKRIDDGSYGYCEETGEEIGLGRLEARPIATLTVDAQERRELLQRQFRDDH